MRKYVGKNIYKKKGKAKKNKKLLVEVILGMICLIFLELKLIFDYLLHYQHVYFETYDINGKKLIIRLLNILWFEIINSWSF